MSRTVRDLCSRRREVGTRCTAGVGPLYLVPAVSSHFDGERVQDPYDLDFLALDPGYTEQELEDPLVARMTHFFTELGAGFAFVGRQYRLPVGEEFFIDLLFFHLGLRRYIVFEPARGGSAGPAEPRRTRRRHPGRTTPPPS